MSLTITAAQRDLLYENILDHLSGLGDVELARRQGDSEAAGRLGMAFSDSLRLLSEDLGWSTTAPAHTIQLTSPPDVLQRAFSRLQATARDVFASEEAERSALCENASRAHLVVEACQQVLTELDAASGKPTDNSRPS